jgi:hypothetical protein
MELGTRHIIYASICLALAGVASCSSGKFTSQEHAPNPKHELPPVFTTIKLPCQGLETPKKLEYIKGFTNTRVILEGELCHQAESQVINSELTILFAVDFSGSMGSNDPAVSGSCGRRRAIEAILDRVVKTTAAANTNVKFGILGFDSDAGIMNPLEPLRDNTSVSSSDLCLAHGSTNYEAAFNLATSMLADESGRKALYFISDGLPTKSSAGQSLSDEKGLEAATALRNSIDDLSLFAIYLDGPDGSVTGGKNSDITDPESYLSQITGNAENVKIVSSASDLVEKILTFKIPDAVNVELMQPTANLSSPGFSEQSLVFESFAKQATKAGSWLFKTLPIKLNYRAGDTVKNVVVIRTKASDGMVKSTSVDIDFTVPAK